MKAGDMGVSPPGDPGKGGGDIIHGTGQGGEAGDGSGNNGGGAPAGAGAGDGTPKKPIDGGTAGGGQDDGTRPDGKDNSDKRINDLMSNWQREEHLRRTAEEKVEIYKGLLDKAMGGKTPAAGAEEMPDYLKPGWEPQTMEELRQAIISAEERGFKRTLGHLQTEDQARTQAKETVDRFIEQVKTADPTFDEDDFFDYASEIGFPIQSEQHLRAVYQAYARELKGKAGAANLENQNKDRRGNDRVNKPGAGGQPGPVIPYSEVSRAGTFHEAAMEALKRHQ